MNEEQKQRAAEYHKDWYQKNKERVYWRARELTIRNQFGISLDEYNRIMEGPCGICGEDSEHLDHDHQSGVVRGPLCRPCNVGLGFFRDNPSLLRSAAEYLGDS